MTVKLATATATTETLVEPDDSLVTLNMELLADNFGRVKAALFSLPVLGGLVGWVFWGQAHPSVIIGWWLALSTAALIGYVIGRAFARHERGPEAYAQWRRLRVLSAAANGLAVGSAALLFYRSDLMAEQVFLMLFIAGTSAAALASTSSVLPALYAYMLSATAPLVIRLLVEGGQANVGLAGMTALYSLVLVSMGRRTNRTMLDALLLKQQNERLVDDLSRANDELQDEVRVRTLAEQRANEQRRLAEAASSAKSQFLALLSHELRTPLNAVIGFSKVVKTRLKLKDEPEAAYLDRIGTNGKHLLTIIEDLLELASAESSDPPQLEMVEVAPLVSAVVQRLQIRVANTPVQLLLDPAAGEPRCRTDPAKLKKVLTLLLDNAIKFTSKGSITVRLIAAGDQVDDRRMRVEIVDTGIGISAERQPIIFNTFQQAQSGHARPREGLGIGLSIARRICEALGHELTVTSTPDRGTTATVILC